MMCTEPDLWFASNYSLEEITVYETMNQTDQKNSPRILELISKEMNRNLKKIIRDCNVLTVSKSISIVFGKS